jgi:protein SCO1/2
MGLLVSTAGVSLAHAQPSGPMSVPPPGIAATKQIPMLRDVSIDQKLDQQIPLDTPFVDQDGKDVTLRQYFGAKPVVLALVYYDCPMLCTQVLNGLSGSLEGLTFSPGKEFELVVVSFDAGETPSLAAQKRQTYVRRYGRAGTEGGIHFLTGRTESIKALTSAVGFRYAYDEKLDQYAHPAAITVLTPEGLVSRYLFGIEFAPRDLRLALVEAADHKIGTAIDQALLFCYHYDPETGKYGFVVMNIVRLAAILTIVALGAFILINLRRDRRQAHAVGPTATGTR